MKKLVLYAEGAGELSGSETRLPPTGVPLPEEMLGAAHVLLRRAAALAWNLSELEVSFSVPNRTRGRHARGSDLLDRTRLRQLVTWPKPEQVPDLVIVLIDSDGDRQRGTKLREWLHDKTPSVIAVAIEEFESWLIADSDCVRSALGGTAALEGAVPEPEKLAPREAKGLLSGWLGVVPAERRLELRRSIAQTCSLQLLQDRCPSFADVARDLRALA